MLKGIAKAISFLVVASFLVIYVQSCRVPTEQPPRNVQQAKLIQEWFPNSNYAGALFAAKEFAPRNDLELIVQPGSDQLDPVKMVISGESTFGDASADKILVANDKGANLVIIGVVSYNSPTCFLAKEEKNIRTPKDFEGKRVGILTGTNTEYVYRTLVKKMDLDVKKIKEVEAPFEITSFITSDEYDVRPAFIYDEPISLDQKNIRYTLIEPRNYGVSFIGTVYFTTRETVEKHPELVQKFIDSVADGWSAAIKYPERGIEFLKIYDPNVDAEREQLSLKRGLSYFQGQNNRILWVEQENWEGMVQSLKELGVLSKEFDLSKSKTLNNEFLLKYYGKRTQ